MSDKAIVDELRAIKNRLMDVEIKLSAFYDARHEESVKTAIDLENAVCELSEQFSE